MANLELNLEGQFLTRKNEVILAAGDAGTDTCTFTFDAEWEEYPVKTAVFWQQKEKEQYAVLSEQGTCTIPAAAMAKEGYLWLGVFGINGKKILTSSTVRVELLEGAVDSGAIDMEPSDDIFLAIIAKFQAVVDMADNMDAAYQEVQRQIEKQNETLRAQTEMIEKLGQFDAGRLEDRMGAVELGMNNLRAVVAGMDTNFRIDNVPVYLDENNSYVYEDSRVTEQTLCDVYFEPECIAAAGNAVITVQSFQGHIQFSARFSCADVLMCSVYCIGQETGSQV